MHLNREHEQFISEQDEELNGIRERELRKLMQQQQKREEKMNAKPAHVTDADFDETVCKNSLALIDFWADWCGPCRMIAPVIEELAKDYSGKVFVAKLNVDENPSTAERFQVYSIPTMLVMKDGKEVDRIVGCVPKNQIADALNKHLR
jgi:thioredoxin 1